MTCIYRFIFRPRHDATRLVIEDLQINHHSNSTDSTSIRGIFLGRSVAEISTETRRLNDVITVKDGVIATFAAL